MRTIKIIGKKLFKIMLTLNPLKGCGVLHYYIFILFNVNDAIHKFIPEFLNEICFSYIREEKHSLLNQFYREFSERPIF